MCAILLSINPNHVENILNGSKKYEFRKKACKRHVDKILIYSTTPIMKIVGEAEVEDVLVDEPETIWKNVIKYGKPKELKDFGVNSAPQSFQYID